MTWHGVLNTIVTIAAYEATKHLYTWWRTRP